MVRSVNCELNSGLDSFKSTKLPNLLFVRDSDDFFVMFVRESAFDRKA